MAVFEAEPLDPATWFERIRRLRRQAEKATTDEPARLIRIAFHLVRLAPGAMQEALPPPVDEDHLEGLLACAAYETAVLLLMGPRASFRAEKPFGETSIEVSVVMDPNVMAGIARHRLCSLAMLTAWAQCLANLGARTRLSVSRPAPRKSPGGSPPSSTAH